jgi:hypothetical protein
MNIADVISLYTTSSRYTIAGFIRDNIIAVLKKVLEEYFQSQTGKINSYLFFETAIIIILISLLDMQGQ